jgi:hypothetical protein
MTSSQQFYEQVQREEEWLYEAEARRVEDANAELREISAARDEEFRAEIEAKYPILKGWK